MVSPAKTKVECTWSRLIKELLHSNRVVKWELRKLQEFQHLHLIKTISDISFISLTFYNYLRCHSGKQTKPQHDSNQHIMQVSSLCQHFYLTHFRLNSGATNGRVHSTTYTDMHHIYKINFDGTLSRTTWRWSRHWALLKSPCQKPELNILSAHRDRIVFSCPGSSITLVGEWVSHCHFIILTQIMTFETWDRSDIWMGRQKDKTKTKDKNTKRQKDKRQKRQTK